MPRCAFGCKDSGVVMHRFPNPEKYPKRFKVWVDLVGEGLNIYSEKEIYQRKKICDFHFINKYRNRNKRLSNIAVPSLFIPEPIVSKHQESAVIYGNEPVSSTNTSATHATVTDTMTDLLTLPDVCRFCLAENGAWDLTGAYVSEGNGNEVLLDMLRDCLGIALSNVREWGPSRFVCDSCATSLRQAHKFRQQVLRAEETFAAYHKQKGGHSLDLSIKSEESSEQEDPCYSVAHDNVRLGHKEEKIGKRDDINENVCPDDITEVNSSEEPLYKVKQKQHDIKKYFNKTYFNQKAKDCCQTYVTDGDLHTAEICSADLQTAEINSIDKHLEEIVCEDKSMGEITKTLTRIDSNKIETSTNVDYYSDTSISDLTKETTDYNQNDSVTMAEIVKTCEDESNNIVKSPTNALQRLRHADKQVSERKRIRLTCETVLKHTTACPFRHYKSWFQCFYCTLEFMEINMLRQHMLQNHKPEDVASIKRYPRSLQIDITDFQCKICSINLIDVKNMVKHFAEAHNKAVYKECIADYKVNASPYTCHICCKQYHVFRTLTTHLNEHYANCICDVCGKSFLNLKRLKVHKRTHESGNFPCKECGKILKTKTSKANHMESHSKRIIKCHLCLKPMKHYNDRIKHMSEEHNITHKFICLICGREYKIKHYLATHIRQTHGHKNKKCMECGMAFITSYGLKKHMLKHTGVKAFACTICNKSYARSYSLREHMRVHDSEPKFVGS